MAYFAQLDKDNNVVCVQIVANIDTCNFDGIEVEQVGQNFLKSMFGQDTRWVQTSYNKKIRVNYAQVGYTYNEELDAFIPPKPFKSWVFNPSIYYYSAPVPKPGDDPEKVYIWIEEEQRWKVEDYVRPIVTENLKNN